LLEPRFTERDRTFLNGVCAGAIISALIVILTFSGISIYSRRTQWGGIDPNRKISEIYEYVNRYSIMEHDKQTMLDNMYIGLLEGVGDPYTQYYTAEALEAFRARNAGYFVGIGVLVSVKADDAYVTIASVLKNTPAEKVGLLPGDQIVKVDGIDTAGRLRDDVVDMMLGIEGTDVTLVVFRPHDNMRLEFELTRARVELQSVFYEMHHTENEAIGYIRIASFDGNTTAQFDEAVAELYADGMKGLIIDLRNNPGGRLDVVTEITDRLIPEGLIVYMEDAVGRRESMYSGPSYLGLPLVLLVNELSASASEVLSGAVRDTEMGTIVGTQTFGKGIVQRLEQLSDGTAIKLTVQRYYTPKGGDIHGVGIEPHIVVEMDEALGRRVGDITLEEDVQLQAALGVFDKSA